MKLLTIFKLLFSISTIAFFSIPFSTRAVNYDFIVDVHNTTGIEDGTWNAPYSSISKAISEAMKRDKLHRKIYVKKGTYQEKITLGKYVKIYGEDQDKTILLGKNSSNDFKYVVKMKDHSRIDNVTIKYGETGILVDKDSRARIKETRVKKTEETGIHVLGVQKNIDRKRFIMSDTKISKGDGVGLRVSDRKVDIQNNTIYENDEEGLILGSDVEGKIASNTIKENESDGVKIRINGADLKFQNNTVRLNEENGMKAEYKASKTRKERALIRMRTNSLKRNDGYGIRCETIENMSIDPNIFVSSFEFLWDNLDRNKKGKFPPECHFNIQ